MSKTTLGAKLPAHSLLLPLGILLAFYGAMVKVTPSDQRVSISAILVVGAAHLVMVWLLFRDGIGRFRMLYDGLPAVEKRVHESETRIAILESMPHNRKVLLEIERQRLGGLDTPQPGDPKMPDFNP